MRYGYFSSSGRHHILPPLRYSIANLIALAIIRSNYTLLVTARVRVVSHIKRASATES